jgi:hypothetical protein
MSKKQSQGRAIRRKNKLLEKDPLTGNYFMFSKTSKGFAKMEKIIDPSYNPTQSPDPLKI